jgi:hypothetical protein
MRGFINTDYIAYIFQVNDETIGYTLVNHTKQPYVSVGIAGDKDMAIRPLYNRSNH